jgi:1,4-dihydroxy-2-naphthoyl-CoA hydrolase
MIPDAQQRIDAVANEQPPFGLLLGTRIVSASLDEVVAEMEATPELGNRNGVLHGGVIMGFADNVGGTASFINRGEGEGSTTLESKTNFMRSVPVGDVLRATARVLHRGRSTLVLQITVTRGDGKVAAITMQTQMRLPGKTFANGQA